MRSAATSSLLVSLVLAVSPHVAAEPTEQHAYRLYRDSREQYRLGAFGPAADLLEQAYRIHPEPVLLFNLARARESDGDLERAAEAYERYLRDAGAVPDQGAIRRRIETLRRQIAERETLQRVARDADADAGELRDPVRLRTAATAPRRSRSVLPWVTLAGGAAIAAGGVVVAILAADRRDDAAAAQVHAEAVDRLSEARDLATGANVLLVTGAAIAAAAIVWVLLD